MTKVICTHCRQNLTSNAVGLNCGRCKITYPIISGIPSFFNPDLEPEAFAALEAKAHDSSAEATEQFMGLDLHYNERLHAFVYQQMERYVPKQSKILEIGSGVGNDVVGLALRGYTMLHASDVSFRSIKRAKERAELRGVGDRISFYQFDGEKLPFADNEFDAIFFVAALHHFQNADDILGEISRCCKIGGHIMAFIEPNSLYYRAIRPVAKRIESLLSPFRRHKEMKRSIAEETAEGFTLTRFYEMSRKAGLKIVDIHSHWVFTGFVYLLQQFFFRLFSRNPRSLLNVLSRITCFVDRYLTRRPSAICWHYSVVFRRT